MRDYSIEEEKEIDARYFCECLEKLRGATADCFDYADSLTFSHEIIKALENIERKIRKIDRELEYTDEQRKIDYELDMEGL